MGGVNGKGGQHREDPVHEPFPQPILIGLGQIWPIHQCQMRFAQHGAQAPP